MDDFWAFGWRFRRETSRKTPFSPGSRHYGSCQAFCLQWTGRLSLISPPRWPELPYCGCKILQLVDGLSHYPMVFQLFNGFPMVIPLFNGLSMFIPWNNPIFSPSSEFSKGLFLPEGNQSHDHGRQSIRAHGHGALHGSLQGSRCRWSGRPDVRL